MAEDNDKVWNETKGKLRRAFNLEPMCREEAEEEAKRTKSSKPMTEEDINSIMEFVQSWGARGGLSAEPEKPQDEDYGDTSGGWIDPVTPEMMEEELLQLNSNAGEKDADTEALLEKLRREALDNDSANDKHDAKDSIGLGDGEEPTGTSR
jgi:hypothetical protein